MIFLNIKNPKKKKILYKKIKNNKIKTKKIIILFKKKK